MNRYDEKRQNVTHLPRLLPLLLIVIGVGIVGISVVPDQLVGGDISFGFNQILLVVTGFFVLLSGVALLTPFGQQNYARFVSYQAATSPALRVQPGELITLAIWFGLVTGLAEVLAWIVLRHFLEYLPVTSLNIIWMAPLANIVLLTGLGFVFFLVTRWWGLETIISLPIAAFIFTVPGLWGLLSLIPGLHRVAELLLAFGLAVQTARWVGAHPDCFYTLLRYSTGWVGIFNKKLASPIPAQNLNDAKGDFLPSRRQFLVNTGATLAGLAVGVQGWGTLVERNALSKLPPANPNMPNVLLIVLDTVRAQNLSLHGYARPTTPHLEQLARGGVCFERAIAAAPWTLPSHASMFTGRWYHELSVNMFEPLDDTHLTLAEAMGQLGYLTAGFIANLDFCCSQYGLNRGFVHYEDFPVSLGQTILSSSLGREISNNDKLRHLVGYLDVLNRKDAARITGDFLGWLSRQQQQPFFAFLNYYDAHQPYLPPESFELKFGPEKPRGNLSYFTNSAELDKPWQMSPQQVQGELDAYDSAISYMDHHLGLLFDELAHQGILENTLIIVTSDHGEQFGEHSLFGHTNSLYIQTLHVPLVISFPGRVPVGVRIPEVASLRDLPTTVLDLIGFKGETRFPGTSLAQHWQEPHSRTSPISESVLSEINHRAHFLQSWYPLTKGDMKSLVTNRYHYIKNGDDREELYDLENDASEEHDLSSSEEGRQAIVQFRTSLEAILAQSSSSTIS